MPMHNLDLSDFLPSQSGTPRHESPSALDEQHLLDEFDAQQQVGHRWLPAPHAAARLLSVIACSPSSSEADEVGVRNWTLRSAADDAPSLTLSDIAAGATAGLASREPVLMTLPTSPASEVDTRCTLRSQITSAQPPDDCDGIFAMARPALRREDGCDAVTRDDFDDAGAAKAVAFVGVADDGAGGHSDYTAPSLLSKSWTTLGVASQAGSPAVRAADHGQYDAATFDMNSSCNDDSSDADHALRLSWGIEILPLPEPPDSGRFVDATSRPQKLTI